MNRVKVRRPGLLILGLILSGLFLTGCPKKIPPPVVPTEKPPFVNPMDKLLQTFSPVESLQAKASIRIDTVERGEKNYFLLNGVVYYQKPDKLRILGFHPFGMALFDTLYRDGELFILIPLQKRAYAGEVSEFQDLIEKAGEIDITSTRNESRNIPSRIRIVIVEKEIDIELRLKDVSVDRELPQDAFEWTLPNGVDIRPLERLLRGKRGK